MKKLVIAIFLFIIILPVMAQDLKDPYEILRKELESQGGKEKLESIISTKTVKNVEIKSQGRTDNRTETIIFYKPDTTTFKLFQKFSTSRGDFISGYNGEVAWKIENGKYSLIEDEEEKEDVEDKKEALYDQYEYLNPDSKYYSVKFKGVKKVKGKECYYIRIKNKDKKITTKRYIDVETFDIVKNIRTDEDGTRETLYSDYRTVNGFRNAYVTESLILTYDNPEPVNYKVVVSSLSINGNIDQEVFEPKE